MAQITNKKYRCTKCGHESTQATNHYGATWSVGNFNTCKNCPPYAKYPQYGGQTEWECIEQPKTLKNLQNE